MQLSDRAHTKYCHGQFFYLISSKHLGGKNSFFPSIRAADSN